MQLQLQLQLQLPFAVAPGGLAERPAVHSIAIETIILIRTRPPSLARHLPTFYNFSQPAVSTGLSFCAVARPWAELAPAASFFSLACSTAH